VIALTKAKALAELWGRSRRRSDAGVADGAILLGMSAPARRVPSASYDELLKLPSHVVGEILDGEMHATPRPRLRHARSAWKLTASLDGPFDRGAGGPGGWLFLAEPELHLGPNVVVPDLAGWRREQLPDLPDEAFLTLAPHWVCEITSPSTQRIDCGVKMDIYLREHAHHVWLLDPIERLVEVFHRSDRAWVRLGSWTGGMPARLEPFDAIELDLDAVWS
jgi:Uma2 family endonuclease